MPGRSLAPSCAARPAFLPAVLASRVIDRSIRPLFPYDFRNDVVVTATVMDQFALPR